MKKNAVLILILAVAICFLVTDVQAQQKIKVGIIQLLENPDFDSMRKGFLETLKAKNYTVETTYFNANVNDFPQEFIKRGRDSAQKMLAEGVDLFFAPGMYLHLKDHVGGKPLFDTTLYVIPLTMPGNYEERGNKVYCTGNATGTYLTYPFKEIVEFIKVAIPKTKKIAYIHNPDTPVNRPIAEFEEYATDDHPHDPRPEYGTIPRGQNDLSGSNIL